MRASNTGLGVIAAGLAAMCLVCGARGQTAATQPVGGRSLLAELNQETTALYQQASISIVRVQLPHPPSVFDALGPMDDPLKKWLELMDPSMRRQLFPDVPAGEANNAAPSPAPVPNAVQKSNPGTSANSTKGDANKSPAIGKSTAPPTTQNWSGSVVIRSGSGAAPILVLPAHNSAVPAVLSPNALGIVLDDRGDVMVPMWEDHDLATSEPIVAVLSDGRSVRATYIGGDPLTNVSVIHLDHFDQRPAVVGRSAPDDGSLVMLVALDSTHSRLAVWNGPASPPSAGGGATSATGAQGPAGSSIAAASSGLADDAVIVNVNGSVAGLTLHGRYLPMAPYELIVRQIVDTGGFHHRAMLGVEVGLVDASDPARMGTAALGTRPAVRVRHVFAGSPAERAGIRVGDMILTVAGQPIDLPQALVAIAATHEGPTPVTLIRDGREMAVVATLEIAP